MCLQVFCSGNNKKYGELHKGAAALGSAYQKVNFLRDMADDYKRLGRVYFPGTAYESFSDDDKRSIIADIEKDFTLAHGAIKRLPRSSRLATMTSYAYYRALLAKLKRTPATTIKQSRVRISSAHKLLLLCKVLLQEGWKR